MKKFSKTSSIISAVIVAVIALGGYTYYDKKTSEQEQQVTETVVETENVTPESEQSDVSSEEQTDTASKEDTVEETPTVELSEDETTATVVEAPVTAEENVPEEQKY